MEVLVRVYPLSGRTRARPLVGPANAWAGIALLLSANECAAVVSTKQIVDDASDGSDLPWHQAYSGHDTVLAVDRRPGM